MYSKGKVESTGSGASMKASASKSGGDSSGVTGSARHYPKGKTIRPGNWNPIKCAASTYGIKGC